MDERRSLGAGVGDRMPSSVEQAKRSENIRSVERNTVRVGFRAFEKPMIGVMPAKFADFLFNHRT